MKRISNILKLQLWISVVVSLVVVVLYENNVLLPGCLAGNAGAEFVLTTIMEIVTICLIPLSMRLYRFASIHRRIIEGTRGQWLFLGTVRMMMLCVPMVVNTLLYYWFGFKVAFGYMAIIGLVCLSFVYPTETRCKSEFSEE